MLPKMTVTSARLNPSVLLPRQALTPPDFKGVPAELVFPARARHEGIFDGRAVVGVMLAADGRSTDILLLKYSKRYFGDELLMVVRNERFTPRRIRGVAVPGRLNIGHKFQVGGSVAMSPMDALAEFTRRVAYTLDGGAPYEFEPCLEQATDGGTLRFIHTEVPALAQGLAPLGGEPLTVIVSFYVDGDGLVRLPNVESDTPPAVIVSVLRAVAAWRFSPPTVKQHPALVFAIRAMRLEVPRS